LTTPITDCRHLSLLRQAVLSQVRVVLIQAEEQASRLGSNGFEACGWPAVHVSVVRVCTVAEVLSEDIPDAWS
jgi:hypothetical protein